MLVGMVTPVLAGAGTEAYVNDDEINVRTGPGTSYSAVLFNGQKNIRLYRGQYVRIVSTQKGSDGMNWHQIVFTYNGYTKIGFMRSDFITEIGDDSAYRAYLEEQGFPESYRPYLRALYAASGGKWTFVANKTGLKWNEALEMESTLGVSFIHESYGTALRSTVSGSYDNGAWKQPEPDWYYASKETVAFYMDPRTYLVDGTCVAFELLAGNDSITHEQLKKVLGSCAWATDAIIDEFLQAAKEANVSPIFLAVKARNELGTGNSRNASGYPLDDGKKYYNFFNIGAYGGDDPNYNGILYAREHGWDTSYKALLGGALFIYRNYIEDGQNTQYLQRFNFCPTDPKDKYTYQYATGARTGARTRTGTGTRARTRTGTGTRTGTRTGTSRDL